MNYFKFSNTAQETVPDILKGGTEKEFLVPKYSAGSIQLVFGLDNLLRTGVYRLLGWEFNFKGHLKLFYYQDKRGECYKAYAPNKTLLRKAIYGTIFDIVEIERKYR